MAGSSDDRSPEPGTLLAGRYRLASVLGRGAMGVVYQAHDTLIDRPVAIKLILTEILEAEERDDFLGRFRTEARAAGRCTHPGIVGVYDLSDDPDRPFIVMEFVEGRTLQSLLRQERVLPPDRAVAIVLQVLDALEAAHRQAIVHRDIKPANVMIMAGDRVKLMDFGVARMTGSTRTEVGSMIGTVRYAAPEQVTGSTVDHRADLFSTAVMLFELLTATTPYPGRTAPEVLSRLLGPEPADLSALGATLKPLEPVLARALAKLPDRRYPGAESFASALRQSLAASGAADPDDDRTIIAPSTRRAAPPSEAIDASLLSAVERELATVVGPISKLLVRQAAGATDDSSELVATIARGIPNEADRERFLTQFRSQAPAAPAPSTRVPTPPAAVAAEVPAAALAEAERVLTFFMGPIARLMVRKESGTPCSVGELGRRLAAHIDRADQRNAFIDRYRKDVESRFPSAGTS